MKLDMERVVGDRASTFSEAIGDGFKHMHTLARWVLADHRRPLAEFGEARINGVIDGDTFEQQLERERQVLTVQALTLETTGRATAQNAVNEAVAVFARAVARLIRGGA